MNECNPLGRLFHDSSVRFADKVAIRTPKGEITYAVLHKITINFALHLRNLGVKRGSLVALGIGKKTTPFWSMFLYWR